MPADHCSLFPPGLSILWHKYEAVSRKKIALLNPPWLSEARFRHLQRHSNNSSLRAALSRRSVVVKSVVKSWQCISFWRSCSLSSSQVPGCRKDENNGQGRSGAQLLTRFEWQKIYDLGTEFGESVAIN